MQKQLTVRKLIKLFLLLIPITFLFFYVPRAFAQDIFEKAAKVIQEGGLKGGACTVSPAHGMPYVARKLDEASCKSGEYQVFNNTCSHQLCVAELTLRSWMFSFPEPTNGKCEGTAKVVKVPGVENKFRCISQDSFEFIPHSLQTTDIRKAVSEQREKEQKATRLELGSGKITQPVLPYVTQIQIPCQPIAGGKCPTIETPAGYIARLYQFGLMIVGLLAFGAIVVGSVQYILSAGSVANQQDATDRIRQAILGLVLLLGAYLILYTINPDLVDLRNPRLEAINLEAIKPPPEVPEKFKNQSLGSGAADEKGDLCKIRTNIQISLGQRRGEISCIECEENASIKSGVCACNEGYYPYQSACITSEQAETIGLIDSDITNEKTCNETTDRIWRDGRCFVESLGF